MKFLVDAQPPLSLCRTLVEHHHDAIHTSNLVGGNATTDEALRSAAVADGRVVVTKDLGVFDVLVLRGAPPKLVLVRCGNLRKRDLVALFVDHLDAIDSGLEDADLVEIESPAFASR